MGTRAIENALVAAGVLLCAACVIDTPKPGVSRFQLAWTFEGGGDCESLGVEVVQVNIVHGDGQFQDALLCTELVGVTHPVEAQINYSLQLVALDADGDEVGRSEARTHSVLGRGQTAELEPFTITTSGP